ncbi:MAG: hypothetical protein CR997_11670 [Acidobacteria bacterium]|nr:MAG: hypothetical protein CR997_11670 [Acidobacteriota bacterium]
MEDVDSLPVHILLHQIEGPINLGSILRVMANFNFTSLRFTGPLTGEEEEVRKFALHAADIMTQAVKCADFTSLMEHCHIVVGLTPRSPWQDARQLRYTEFPDYVAKWLNDGLDIGLLFGNEAHGLSNRELSRCDYRLSLPTSEVYPSMNLSHAVAATLLPLHQVRLKGNAQKTNLIRSAQKELLTRKMLAFMSTMNFLPQEDSDTRQEMEALWSGRGLTQREWELLMGLFNKATSRYRALLKKSQDTK